MPSPRYKILINQLCAISATVFPRACDGRDDASRRVYLAVADDKFFFLLLSFTPPLVRIRTENFYGGCRRSRNRQNYVLSDSPKRRGANSQYGNKFEGTLRTEQVPICFEVGRNIAIRTNDKLLRRV